MIMSCLDFVGTQRGYQYKGSFGGLVLGQDWVSFGVQGVDQELIRS